MTDVFSRPWTLLSAALILSLAGCVNASIDVDVTSATTAKVVMTQVMDRSYFDMIEAARSAKKTPRQFCKTGTLAVTDTAATCTINSAGKFAALRVGTGKVDGVQLSAPEAGLVRVVFMTSEIAQAFETGNGSMDAKTRAMMIEAFVGHAVSFKVTGGDIVYTNMDVSEDKSSAEIAVALDAMLAGTAKLPNEYYAVVRR